MAKRSSRGRRRTSPWHKRIDYFQKRLGSAGVMLPAPQLGGFLVGVNETLNRTTARALTDAFVRALVA
jgi:hypothetical protein